METESYIFIIASIGFAFIGAYLAYRINLRRMREKERNTAEKIIEDAKRESERIILEGKLHIKELSLQNKVNLEKDLEQKKTDIFEMERRLRQKEDDFDKKTGLLEKKENEVLKKAQQVENDALRLKEQVNMQENMLSELRHKLENVSGMTADEAKHSLISMVEGEAKLEQAKVLKRVEEETKEMAQNKSQEIISLAIQRYAGEYVSDHTISVVPLPNDEMKGRIIGREGRNIRSIETATGVDIIVDDTPEAVIISSFDPQRREIARLALEKLISDGRIHPGRIEEVVEKTSKEVEKTIKEAGERAVFDLGLHGIHPEIIRLLGRLRYRSSYSQNVYAHSMEVAFICGIMASELGLNIKQAKRAALLHDIGKSVDHEIEGTHASIGGELAKKYGESQRIVEAIAEHHNDSPSNILAVLIQASDTLSAARPGVRKEIWETYVKRLNDMERIAKAIPGIDKCYAIQAGRELRVIVMPDKIKDDGIGLVSREIAKKIEAEVAYPGQIKVTVIRELRSVEYAK